MTKPGKRIDITFEFTTRLYRKFYALRPVLVDAGCKWYHGFGRVLRSHMENRYGK